MKYTCWFPECTYCTKERSKIDYHHVIPKEIDKTKVTIPLCKNHHSLIYIPESGHGQHSIKTPDSLIIKSVLASSMGKSVLYERTDGSQFYYFPSNGDIWDN
jgi:hypothetical protein